MPSRSITGVRGDWIQRTWAIAFTTGIKDLDICWRTKTSYRHTWLRCFA